MSDNGYIDEDAFEIKGVSVPETAPETDADMECDMEATVYAWEYAKSVLDGAKETEMALRTRIWDYVLEGLNKGSKTKKIGGVTVTATAKLNASIDKDALKSIWADLKKEEKAAIKFDPKIVAALFGKLPENSILNQVITHKPAAPSITIKKKITTGFSPV